MSKYKLIKPYLPHSHEIARAMNTLKSINYDHLVMILDSAATKHISGQKELFASLHIFPPDYNRYVILGDGKTKIKVAGIGDLILKIKDKIIELIGVVYIPDLSETLFSTLEHGCNTNCSFSIQDNCATLGFQDFELTANVSKEITLDIE
eukprot:7269993-Ditylum_brightwellii.AAC.2